MASVIVFSCFEFFLDKWRLKAVEPADNRPNTTEHLANDVPTGIPTPVREVARLDPDKNTERPAVATEKP